MSILKELVKKTFVGRLIQARLSRQRQAQHLAEKRARELQEWEAKGRPAPPPHVIKQRNLKAFAKKYDLKVLVETGTYLGEMIEAMKDSFSQIYTIELDHKLAANAKEAFKAKKHIEVIQGDSSVEIRKILARLQQPALFWLDGHYSGGITAQGEKDTPIFEELEHILSMPEKRHVIFIDDARLFGTDPGYPKLEEVTGFIRAKRADVQISVADDSIRVEPASGA